MKMGICMEGMEGAFESLIRQSMAACGGVWNYVEIGVGYGGTLASVSKIASEHKHGARVVGVDLANGWSLDRPAIVARIDSVAFFESGSEQSPPPIGTSVYLCGSTEFLSNLIGDTPIHFAFIDGCHCRQCAASDWLAVERRAVVGSTVAFHDALQEQQGGMTQHVASGSKPRPLEVYKALEDVGLIKGLPLWTPIRFIVGETSGIAYTNRTQYS